MKRQQRMFMRGVYLTIWLGHLLIVGAGSTCIPVQCLRCNTTGATQVNSDPCKLCSIDPTQCINVPPDIPLNCKEDFQVSISSNGSELNEGDDINLSCDHNLPNLNLTFGWKRDSETIEEGKNKSKLSLKKVLKPEEGEYICFVNSSCGYYESSPHSVTVNNQSVVILVVCGVAALVLVLVMGLAMKFKLRRDNARHRERQRQRANMEPPASFVPNVPGIITSPSPSKNNE